MDFNRSGAPLMEIVTEPDIRTAEQARRYAEELQLLLRAIGASDAEMENGQLRVEANVSLRLRGAAEFGTRVEVKNMNSFRSVERAIGYEIERQAAALDSGESIHMETRGWDDGRQATYHMRPKEQSDDYRYFPEPDLPPLHVQAAWLEAIRAGLPELPAGRRERYRKAMGLSAYDAAVLVNDPNMSAAFEAILAVAPDLPAKEVANLVTGEYGRHAREIAERGATGLVGLAEARSLADLIRAVLAGRLSRTNARDVLAIHLRTGQTADQIIAREGFAQISEGDTLTTAVDAAIAANPAAVADYRAGKAQAVGFLVGQVMKATRGQADAAKVQEALRERLDVEVPKP